MAAITTQKVQSTSLNLGMPSAYSSVYANHNRPMRYYPEYQPRAEGFWAGNGVQANYHEQKRKDANYMANEKALERARSFTRFASAAHGEHRRPNSLVQRKYANPSLGNQAIYFPRPSAFGSSGAGMMDEDEMTGGVLRSSTGQAYGKARLLSRVGELNAIEAAKQMFQLSQPTSSATPEERSQVARFGAVGAEVELNLLLQSILDAVVGSDAGLHLSSFTYNDSVRFLQLLFRLAPENPEEVITNSLQLVEPILADLESLTSEDGPNISVSDERNRRVGLTMLELFTKVEQYLKGMDEGRNRSPSERLALSKALVKSLGFANMLRGYDWAAAHKRQNAATPGQLLAAEDEEGEDEDDDEDGDEDDYDDDEDGDEVDDGGFDRPARPREDEEHAEQTGMPRNPDWEDENRNRFGDQAGQYTDAGVQGAPRAYLGEDVAVENRGQDEAGQLDAPSQTDAGIEEEAGLSAAFNPETGEHDVNVAPKPTRKIRIKPAEAAPAPAPARQSYKPKSRSDLPTTREGFVELAHKLNTYDKILINIYSNSSIQNIRRNFIKRLGL